MEALPGPRRIDRVANLLRNRCPLKGGDPTRFAVALVVAGDADPQAAERTHWARFGLYQFGLTFEMAGGGESGTPGTFSLRVSLANPISMGALFAIEVPTTRQAGPLGNQGRIWLYHRRRVPPLPQPGPQPHRRAKRVPQAAHAPPRRCFSATNRHLCGEDVV